VPVIGASVAVGVGGKVEDAADTALQFEVGRSPVVLTSYDFVTNKLIFKASVPSDFGGTIYEIGLFTQESDTLAGGYGSRLLVSFDSATEEWYNPTTTTDSTYTTASARIGLDALVLTPAASASTSARMDEVSLDLSGNSAADKFSLAYNVGANVSSINMRFKTDASNYYSYTITSPATGYRIDTFTKGSAVVTGTPNWNAINSLEMTVNASAAGAASASFDGIRIEDVDTNNPAYLMVSRRLLATPFVKTAGMVQEIEFALDVAV
jgi:hypothetical protein